MISEKMIERLRTQFPTMTYGEAYRVCERAIEKAQSGADVDRVLTMAIDEHVLERSKVTKLRMVSGEPTLHVGLFEAAKKNAPKSAGKRR